MALSSDAMMVLFYDFEGDTADHDDWHSNQHFRERLLVPGFLRATRWIATSGAPRYLVTYDVTDVDVSTSDAYLERLNDPTPWTREMMPRFRGMTRGFCDIIASHGLGLGSAALAVRFTADKGDATLVEKLSCDVLPDIVAMPEMVSALLLRPVARPPMTREQFLRGADQPMPWLILVTAHDPAQFQRVAMSHLDTDFLRGLGVSSEIIFGQYALAHIATSEDAT
ncbi:hypothetical protein [Marivita sp.]|uniref:hypothetical protein n=1 Tax=Marivita sp. TaxID=2003365 RepID=UPI003F71D443